MKSKGTSRQSGATPATSKRTFEVDLPKRFRDRVRRLSKTTRQEAARTIEALREAVGQPHLPTELGIRKLHHNYFECRVGITLRLVFRLEAGLVTFTFAGSHDECGGTP